MEFSGKVVLVTGASSGIGAETALLLGGRGAELALTGRDTSALGAVAARCEAASGRKVFVLAGSLQEEGFPKRLVKETVQRTVRFGRLDVLVNNAGALISNSLANLKPQETEQLFQVNLFAVMRLTEAAVPHLKATKGNVVNVSSIAGMRGFPGLVAYSTSKAALDHLTRCAALELGPTGVRVNSVNPGTISTQIQRDMGFSAEDYADYLERAKGAHALGRIGTTEEVAAAIAFLAGPGASFITGAILPVDGGRSVMCPVSFKDP